MPKVRLSGRITGEADPNRESRARVLYRLFASGWDIENSNGDQRVNLSNIESKIRGSDAFVFMPNPSLEDIFKAVSIFVGYQTLDPNLRGKATVIMDTDESWQPLFELFARLEELGMIRQDFRKFLLRADSPEALMAQINHVREVGTPDAGRGKLGSKDAHSFESPCPDTTRANVCVFCSASIKNPAYLEDGYRLGRAIAENQLGCVSGAGTTGIMGTVVQGAVEAGGWTAGSNVPHIIEIEGLPKGLSAFWLRPDIYTRMEVMIERSDAFVIFPGGAGTVQELLALLIFKLTDHPMMSGKPIVLYNRPTEATPFWDKLIALLDNWQCHSLYTSVDRFDAILPTVQQLMEAESAGTAI